MLPLVFFNTNLLLLLRLILSSGVALFRTEISDVVPRIFWSHSPGLGELLVFLLPDVIPILKIDRQIDGWALFVCFSENHCEMTWFCLLLLLMFLPFGDG